MARKPIAFLALSLMITATLSAGAVGTADTEVSFDEVNRSLKGHRATIEMNGHEPVSGARDVAMGPIHTTWRIGTQQQQIATSAVQRITIEKRSRSLKWMKRGALVGGGLGAVSFSHSGHNGTKIHTPDAFNVVRSAAAGAAVGAATGAIAGEKVVFEASSAAPVDSNS
jgi:hypothetical protein